MADESAVQWNRRVLIPVAVVVPLLLCALLSIWRDTLPSAISVLLLVSLVVAAAATGDRWAGISAALAGAVGFDFFLTQPYLGFTITKPDEIAVTILLLLIGTAVTEVALWGRREQARSSRRAGYLDGVLGTAELVLVRHESVETLVERVSGQITEVLGVARCRFVAGGDYDSEMALLEHDGTVTKLGHPVNVDRDGLPTDDETALLVRRDGDVMGYFVMVSAGHVAYPTLEQRRVAVLLADQVATLLGERPR